MVRREVLVLLVFLTGCAIPLRISTNPAQVSMVAEKKIINSLETREEKIIVLAFYKAGFDMFEISKELNSYGKNDIKGFCEYLKTTPLFNKWFGWALDKKVFSLVKKNYKLLNEIYDEKEDIVVYCNTQTVTEVK